jgi:hypothetical protein
MVLARFCLLCFIVFVGIIWENSRVTEPGRGKARSKPAIVAADDNRAGHFAFRFKGFIMAIMDLSGGFV